VVGDEITTKRVVKEKIYGSGLSRTGIVCIKADGKSLRADVDASTEPFYLSLNVPHKQNF
jgi:hypothetical protein